jgi:Ca2+-binding RTX toxin-like protein
MAIPQSSIIALSLMYTNLPPSASDLTYWASPEGQSVSWNQAVQAFSTASAAKTAYPMLASPTVLSKNAAARRDYVTQAFQNLYGIAAADIPAAELTYWADTYLLSSPQAIFDFPVVLNQFSPASRQQALTNRAQVAENFAVAMAADGSSTFTSAQYSSGWVIVNTVTADAASVTAANAQIAQFIAGGGGGTGTTFTLLENGAVLTASASSKVSPAGQFLTASNNTVQALTFLPNSFVQDPSTADADVLTAQILGAVLPNIANIETIEFTGSNAAAADIVNISGVKSFVIKSGNLQVNTAEKFPLTLAAGYANQLTLNLADTSKASTVNLNGTVAGTTIVDLNSAANVNIVVKADSVLKNSNATVATIKSAAGKNNFVISGDKNLTIDGKITVTDAADRLDATDFTGKLTLNLGKDSSIKQIVGGKSDDTFTLTAKVDLINGVTLNGNDGNDTLTVKVGATTAALDRVTNVETVIFKEDTAADTKIITKDTLVASGATLTVDASSFTTKFLDFDGTLETNGSFKITGGALADTLKGGEKNDTLTGGGGTDTLTGNGGNDQFVLNKAIATSAVTVKDFKTIANNNDIFALSNAAFAGAPAVGATLTVSAVAGATNSANTILVDITGNLAGANLSNVRFGYNTTINKLFYDADGNFSAGSILIAESTNALTLAGGLSGGNFTIVA